MPTPDSPLARHAATPHELYDRLGAERGAHPFLVFRDGDGRQVLFVLDEERSRVSIGRNEANDVSLGWDSEVSRLHAELERIGGEWTVADDGLSRNGSYVNEERVTGRRRLRDGDVVRLGRTAIAFRVPDDADSRPTSPAGSRVAVPHLSPGQRRVLVALCRPYKDTHMAAPATNQQIADELFLSVDAVKANLRALFAAFGVDHLPQNQKRSVLAIRAMQLGVVSSRDFEA
jgi:pSer/pThr/pTyr-binding forkhead associated (FHA) protein